MVVGTLESALSPNHARGLSPSITVVHHYDSHTIYHLFSEAVKLTCLCGHSKLPAGQRLELGGPERVVGAFHASDMA